ncbi:MAG: peptidylprolyl isomerase [Deltaproteobacteria bacterium]|nr:peptidylprolyl isomerase [Deltaproteobacteria bacterium]
MNREKFCFKVSFFCFLATLLLTSCASKKEPSVGTVDGQPVTVKELEAYLAFKRIPDDDKDKVVETRDGYLDRAALAKAIEKQKFLDAEMMAVEIEEFKREMLIGRYFEKYLNEQVTDQAVSNYYKSHADEYSVKKVHAAHILVRVSKQMSADEAREKRARIQEAYEKIKSGEAKFEDVAKEYSEDKISAAKGGDLGWLAEGAVDKEFSEKAFSTKAGDITEPFKTPFGYHIVTVLDEPRISQTPLDRVAGKIRYLLRDKARAAEMDRLTKTVKVEKMDFAISKKNQSE